MTEENILPKLDRLESFDERSRDFPIRALLDMSKQPRSYSWGCNAWLDQGREGACVGFAWGHELAARPFVVSNVDNNLAKNIYRVARTLDEWPGENYEGTSVIAGAKAVQKIRPNAMSGYRWAFGIDDVIQTLGYFGPVILGINWYNDMYTPDAAGFIRPTGSRVGGHAILARGVSISRRVVKLRNSWGSDWGMIGDCLITFEDLDKLLRERGEACIPVGRNIG